MKLLYASILLGLVSGIRGLNFVYQDCNSSPNKIVHVRSAHLNPYPVVVPGDLTGDIVIEAPRLVSGNNLRLDIHIQKDLLFWISIPCISNVGSCSYNFCELLGHFKDGNTTNCPAQLTAQDLPCTCPFQPGTYTLKPATFKIPELSGIWSWLASGDYKVDAKWVDTTTGEEVGCYHVEMTLTDPPKKSCTGFLCSIFG